MTQHDVFLTIFAIQNGSQKNINVMSWLIDSDASVISYNILQPVTGCYWLHPFILDPTAHQFQPPGDCP